MKDAAKTIGKLMDKAGNCFVAYIDAEGYPVTKRSEERRVGKEC